MKKDFKRKISVFNSYYLLPSLLFSLIISVAFYFLINAKLAPKDSETISMFITCKKIDRLKLKDTMLEKLKDSGLREFSIYDYREDDSKIGQHYDNFGRYSDFLILQEKDLVDQKEAILDNFVPFSSFNISGTSDSDYYIYNNEKMGLKVFDKDNKTAYSFSTYAEFTSNSFLLINKLSYHYNSKDRNLSELAQKFLENLLMEIKSNA